MDSKLLAMTTLPGEVFPGAGVPAVHDAGDAGAGAGATTGVTGGAALAGPDIKARAITGAASAPTKPILNSRFIELPPT